MVSSTFTRGRCRILAHIGREVPSLKLDLPTNAIGKGYRPLASPLGVVHT